MDLTNISDKITYSQNKSAKQRATVDEIMIKDTTVELNDGRKVGLRLGLSCGKVAYDNTLTEDSVIFEVICSSIDDVTVIDIDPTGVAADTIKLFSEQRGSTIADMLARFAGLTKGFGIDKTKTFSPDAYIITSRGIQLIFLEVDVVHIFQDAAYERIAYQQRHWFGMRTHNKLQEEFKDTNNTTLNGACGDKRKMIPLSPNGEIYAQAWNGLVELADSYRTYRNSIGLTKVVKSEAVPEIFEDKFLNQTLTSAALAEYRLDPEAYLQKRTDIICNLG